jgi:hypothetical protein
MANELEDTAFLASKAGIIRGLEADIVHNAIEIGKHLSEVQDHIKYKNGGFVNWIEKELDWGQAHAYNFITLYKTYGEKSLQRVVNLSLRSLLAIAAAPEEIREPVLEKAKDQRLTKKQVYELIDKVKAEAINKEQELERRLNETRNKHSNLIQKHQKLELEVNLLRKGEKVVSFRTQLHGVIDPISIFLQSDLLSRQLRDLELIKEAIESEEDMSGLARIIHDLELVSKRASEWAQRLTPVHDRWIYYIQNQKGK